MNCTPKVRHKTFGVQFTKRRKTRNKNQDSGITETGK